MRIRPESSSVLRWLALPFGLAAGAGFLAARLWPDLALRAAHCPLRSMTGLPCPTCGGTHAVTALARGDLGTAWTANPAVPLGLALLGVWMIWAVAATLLPAWRREIVLGPREKKAARWGAAFLMAALWARQILTG